MTGDSPSPPSFEEALNELESLVERLEGDDLTLEESLKSFEQGVVLTRTCQKALAEAEQKVAVLSGNTADAETEPFSAESSASES